MPISRYFIHFLPVALITSTNLAGCSGYSDSKKDDMVHRQMEAMVFVEGGAFMMGNPGGWAMGADTIPAHEVVLDDFFIQKYEVTQGDYEIFLEASGHSMKARFYDDKRNESPERFSAELPAPVSWHDAKAFCLWLGEQFNQPVDLPTEAQWEYAARSGGKPVRHATDNGEIEPGRNVSIASGPKAALYGDKRTMPDAPGRYPPNPAGLHDMTGNAAEWVNDYYAPDYYQNSERMNPQGPESGEPVTIAPGLQEPERVMRGGDYQGPIINSSTVSRRVVPESSMPLSSGFRCVKN
ncbi:formylglycine-generating enzyme family protein [Marinobacter sp. LQ44]|uniref:formylglycine-generating enzyme family protein n=1 Tax=unclassified Marinobacter TaxID=83889 RepID=UPI000718E2AE|nr:SUMF1/EgtB/PvdO family nonheme iron enzyme [Marinobacter sp. LQ44]AMQ90285.1 hypothetical protein ASQ50_17180 [Marinobacter sp. LQ44]